MTSNSIFPPVLWVLKSRRITRMLLGMIGVIFTVSSGMAVAAPVNGTYDYSYVSGVFRSFGEVQILSGDDWENFGMFKDGKCNIKERKLKLRTSRLRKHFKDTMEYSLWVKVEASMSGAKFIRFKKKGDGWVGKPSSPVVMKFSFVYHGRKYSGVVRYEYAARITPKGKCFITTTAKGYMKHTGRISGNVTVVCRSMSPEALSEN